jgi:hypothetical protein
MNEKLKSIKSRTYDFSKDDDKEQIKNDMTWLIKELEKERRRLTKYLGFNDRTTPTTFPKFLF